MQHEGTKRFLYFSSLQLMRQYCEEALQYGEMPVMNDSRPRQITIVLNPAANNRFVKM
jgi:hypothetical protein